MVKILLVCVCAVLLAAAPAQGETLAQKLSADMTLAHEAHPHGVPGNYAWIDHGFESPAAPPGYNAMTAWFQWYRCSTAGLDPDDVLEIHNVQTWQLSSSGTWTGPLQTGVLAGAAYPENFQGAPVPANVVAQSPDASWIKLRMSRDGYNVHLYPKARTGYNSATVVGVVVAVETKLWSYGGSTQCTVFGMGADYWQGLTSGSVKGATLGRLVKPNGQWRLATAMFGDEQAILANPPPIGTSPGAVR